MSRVLSVRLSTSVAAAILLVLIGVEAADALQPAYLGGMPSVDRVLSEVKGDSALDTAARQCAAFWQLQQMIKSLAGGPQLTGDELHLIEAYKTGCQQIARGVPEAKSGPAWFIAHDRYDDDKGFRDQLLERLFTKAWRTYYRDTIAINDPQLRRGLLLTLEAALPWGLGLPLSGIMCLSLGIYILVQTGKSRFERLNEYGVRVFSGFWDWQRTRFLWMIGRLLSLGFIILGAFLLFAAFGRWAKMHP
jgi:hypothetical protein